MFHLFDWVIHKKEAVTKQELVDEWDHFHENFYDNASLYFSTVDDVINSGLLDYNNTIEPEDQRFGFTWELEANFKTTDFDCFIQIAKIVIDSLKCAVSVDKCDTHGKIVKNLPKFSKAVGVVITMEAFWNISIVLMTGSKDICASYLKTVNQLVELGVVVKGVNDGY